MRTINPPDPRSQERAEALDEELTHILEQLEGRVDHIEKVSRILLDLLAAVQRLSQTRGHPALFEHYLRERPHMRQVIQRCAELLDEAQASMRNVDGLLSGHAR